MHLRAIALFSLAMLAPVIASAAPPAAATAATAATAAAPTVAAVRAAPTAAAPGPVAPAARDATPLSEAERALVNAVDARQAESLALLQKVVDINSGTLNLEGVRKVGAVFGEELKALGFKVRWEPGESVGRAGHLVATRGTRGPRVLLIGHLDTVYEPRGTIGRFERVSETIARGPGIVDMKGGDVVVVAALRALADVRQLDTFRVTVFFTGDEEKAGRPLAVSRRALKEVAKSSDVALCFENGDNDPAHAIVARRGATEWILKTTGKAGHSSLIFGPELGAGAIFEQSRILEGFRQRLASETDLAYNPGLVLGGTTASLETGNAQGSAYGKANVVSAQAVVVGDVRATSAEQLARVEATMRKIVGESLPQTTAELTFGEGYPPLASVPGNLELLRLLSEASRSLGFGEISATPITRAGAADVSFAAGLTPRVLDGLGIKGGAEHSTDEYADLRTLPMQAKRTALLLMRLANGKTSGSRPQAPGTSR